MCKLCKINKTAENIILNWIYLQYLLWVDDAEKVQPLSQDLINLDLKISDIIPMLSALKLENSSNASSW